MVILAGDHIYKMDYELMLQQHVDSGADVTVGCLEVPRMEATGFGVMHVDDEGHRSPPSSRSPPTRPASPASPTWRSPRWASTSSAPSSSPTCCAATPRPRARAATSARTSSPTSSSTARRSPTASAPPACAPAPKRSPTGATSAPSTPTGRPTSTSPTSSPSSTSTTPTWPIWTYAEIKPPAKFVHDEDGRRGSAVSSLVAGDCIVSGAIAAPLAALHRRAGALLLRRSTRR